MSLPSKLMITRGYISETADETAQDKSDDMVPNPDPLHLAYHKAMEMGDAAMAHSVDHRRKQKSFSDTRDFNSLDAGHRQGSDLHTATAKAFDGIGALAQFHGREDLAKQAAAMSKLHGQISDAHLNFKVHPEVARRSGVDGPVDNG